MKFVVFTAIAIACLICLATPTQAGCCNGNQCQAPASQPTVAPAIPALPNACQPAQGEQHRRQPLRRIVRGVLHGAGRLVAGAGHLVGAVFHRGG